PRAARGTTPRTRSRFVVDSLSRRAELAASYLGGSDQVESCAPGRPTILCSHPPAAPLPSQPPARPRAVPAMVRPHETIQAMASAAIPTSPPATALSRSLPPIPCTLVPAQVGARAATINPRTTRAFHKVLSPGKG